MKFTEKKITEIKLKRTLHTSPMALALAACGGGSNEDDTNVSISSGTLDFGAISHRVGESTHISNVDPRVLEPYIGYQTFINGGFDFTHLKVTADHFEIREAAGPTIFEADGREYEGMVDYSRVGDIDGDGINEMVIGGWTVNTGNAPGRIFLIDFDEEGIIENIDWYVNDGTAAPWVYDFDGDGADEIFSVGFYDFPVAPAQSFYYDGSLDSQTPVGQPIDSHESTLVDYDGDGDMDIVAVTYGIASGHLSLFENTGSGFNHVHLDDVLIGERIAGSSVAVADLNDDGYQEILVGDYPQIHDDIAVLSWDETSSTWVRDEFTLPTSYFVTAAFDGINSIFTSSRSDATASEIAGARSHDIDIVPIDIDGDGDLDILNSTSLWHDTTPMGVIQIFINDGEGNFTDETDLRLFNFPIASYRSPHDLQLTDVNGDGFLDILIAEPSPFNSDYLELEIQDDLARLTEGNAILLNDGEGNFLNVTFGFFADEGVVYDEGLFYAGKWHGMVAESGTLTFVHMSETWDSHPLGADLVFAHYATFHDPLSTGPSFVNPAEFGAPGFNEFYVLRNNPEVQEFVHTGLYGSALEWFLDVAPEGTDTFAANATVQGSERDDVIILREGDETALGFAGEDLFFAKGGNDILTGGMGSDTFVFATSDALSNHNTVTDFTLSEGDQLDLRSFGIDSVTDAMSLAIELETGVIFTLSETASLTLHNLTIDGLHSETTWLV